MSSIEQIPLPPEWIERGGVFWMTRSDLNVREVARAMRDVSARFITITAYQLPGSEGFRLEYHWDIGGLLLGFSFVLAGNSIESIYDLCEAADWIEREVHEEYAIEFSGRVYEPLLLRAGQVPGVNLREQPAKPAPQPAKDHEEAKP